MCASARLYSTGVFLFININEYKDSFFVTRKGQYSYCSITTHTHIEPSLKKEKRLHFNDHVNQKVRVVERAARGFESRIQENAKQILTGLNEEKDDDVNGDTAM